MKLKFESFLKRKVFGIFPSLIIDWEDYLTIDIFWMFWLIQVDFNNEGGNG